MQAAVLRDRANLPHNVQIRELDVRCAARELTWGVELGSSSSRMCASNVSHHAPVLVPRLNLTLTLPLPWGGQVQASF